MKVPALFRRAIGRGEPVEVIDRGDPAEVQERYYTFNDFFRGDATWFQKALDMVAPTANDASKNTAVASCVNILSQEVASLNIKHYKVDPVTRAREMVNNSNPMRVLSRPNEYQTSSDFWLYEMRSLLLAGSATAFVGARNKRQEIETLHPVPRSLPHVSPEMGDVFYSISDFGDGLFETDVAKLVPSRNIFNPRINCNRHPLIGETPIAAYAFSGAMGSNIQRSAARFFNNMSRPSGVLTTPKPLNQKQLDELKTRWGDATRGDYSGGTPVLHSGLKWEQITMSATDSQMIATYNLSVSDIAMAYRIPLYMLGDMSKATFRNVETLFRVFYTGTLRFYLEHLENNLNRLFELNGITEYLQFDIEEGLLRGDLESRMSALSKGVQGGILTPNEARRTQELPPVEGGDFAFLQRQMAPIKNLLVETVLTPVNDGGGGITPPPAKSTEPKDDGGGSGSTVEQEDDAGDMLVRFNSMVRTMPAVLPAVRTSPSVINVSTPVNVDARLDAKELGAAIKSGLEMMRAATITLSPTIVVPRQEPAIVNVGVDGPVINVPAQAAPIVNLTVPEQKAPVVNVAAPVVNVAVPEQKAPIVNIEQKAPVVNVAVPEQKSPVVNVSVPEQKAPVVNIEQKAPVVNVAVPEQKAPVVNVALPRQETPIINVSVPKQQAPVINVTSPDVRVDVKPADAPVINVAVPEQRAPVVNVAVPEQQAPIVNVNLPEDVDREQIVERDEQGELKRVISRKIRRK